jgi:hypothetical protein
LARTWSVSSGAAPGFGGDQVGVDARRVGRGAGTDALGGVLCVEELVAVGVGRLVDAGLRFVRHVDHLVDLSSSRDSPGYPIRGPGHVSSASVWAYMDTDAEG